MFEKIHVSVTNHLSLVADKEQRCYVVVTTVPSVEEAIFQRESDAGCHKGVY